MNSECSATARAARCCGSLSYSHFGLCTTTSPSFTARCETESKCENVVALAFFADDDEKPPPRCSAQEARVSRAAEGVSIFYFLFFIFYFLFSISYFLFLVSS